jgi:hypothetical protein
MALMGMSNGVEGAKALAVALVQNKSLAELSIKGNELGDEGVDALATALLVSLLACPYKVLVESRPELCCPLS